jgi:hypothetical protein
MSELSERSRARAKEKVERITRSNTGKIDASGWTEPLGEKGGVQTGMRVISRRAYRAGGKVHGTKAIKRADRKPRMSGGPLVDDLVNVDMKKANGFRDGEKHEGGLKSGGRAKKFVGGPMGGRPMPVRPEMRPAGRPMMRAAGGPTSRPAQRIAISAMKMSQKQGVDPYNSQPTQAKNYDKLWKMSDAKPARKTGGEIVADGKLEGTRPVGGRLARAKGGSAKKGMNVNIIIAPPQAKPAMPMPPPGMPPGGPPGLHQAPPPLPAAGAPAPQGAMPPPQMRKAGGRAYPLDAGGGGARGRLEKRAAYG